MYCSNNLASLPIDGLHWKTSLIYQAIGKPADCVFPYNLRDVIKKRGVSVELASSERMLLGFFLAKVQKVQIFFNFFKSNLFTCEQIHILIVQRYILKFEI